MDREVDGSSDSNIGASVKEMELQRGYGVGWKLMFINKHCIDKTVGGTRVY